MAAPVNLIPHFIHDRFVARVPQGSVPASVLFVDLAGFTRLADELAGLGRAGAERLADTLHFVFQPLLQEVYSRGGFVASFAGDAFTAVFPEPASDEESSPQLRQASATGSLICRSIETLRLQRAIALGVRVGVARGEVQWGIVGDRRPNAFYFRGQAVEHAAAAQRLAHSGEVVAAADLRSHVSGWASSRKIPNKPFLRLAAVTIPSAKPTVVPSLPRSALSPFVPDSTLDLPQSAEFRDIAPVFISLQGVETHGSIDQCATDVMALCRRFGGYFAQIEFGDKGCLLVVLFGAPVAFEHTADRALEFLLACRTHAWPSPWRAGAAFGTVWAGFRGSIERSEYGAIGDVVNVAARLAVRAPWGEALLADSLARRLTRRHRTEKVGSARLRGRRRHTSVYRIIEDRGSIAGGAHSGSMVGREDELGRLEEFVLPVFDGRFAGVAHVHGEAGMGKSRLAYELQQRLNRRNTARTQWFTCQADEILRLPLHPFRHAATRFFEQEGGHAIDARKDRFGSVFERLAADTALSRHPDAVEVREQLQRLESVLGALVDLHWEGSFYESLDPTLRFENTIVAFRTLIKAQSLARPVVVLVEDIHWLDPASTGFMRRLPLGVQGFPVAFLLTSRYRDDGSRVTVTSPEGIPHLTLDLDTLGTDDVTALAAGILRGPIKDRLRDVLARRAGGNPFFVEQLVLHLRAEGALRQDASGSWDIGAGSAAVPERIGEILVARLDRLPMPVREVVQHAAVLGRDFDLRVLTRMLTEVPDISGRAQSAVSEKVWVTTGGAGFSFRHVLMRDAAYDMQTAARLRELHGRAAESLESIHQDELTGHYMDLAYHSHEAGDTDREKKYAYLAGKEAASSFANSDAERYFTRALELTPQADLAERFGIGMARYGVLDVLGRREDQARALENLSDLADALDDDALRADVLNRRGHLAFRRGDYPSTIMLTREALRMAVACQAADCQIKAYEVWARALIFQGEYAAARELAFTALEASSQHSSDPGSATAHSLLGLIAQYEGRRPDALAHYREALRLSREHDLHRVESATLTNIGNAYAEWGKYAEARPYHEEAARLTRQMGDMAGLGKALTNLGNLLDSLGERTEAAYRYGEALAICREIEDSFGEGNALGNLGLIASAEGDHEKSWALHSQTLCIFQRIGYRWGEAWAQENMGGVAALLGMWDDAVYHYDKALEGYRSLNDRRGEAVALQGLAQASLANGKQETAELHATEALDIAREVDDQPVLGMCLERFGQAAASRDRGAEAADALRKAVALYRSRGEEYLAVGPLAHLADLLLREGSIDEATHCAEAIERTISADTKGLIIDPIAPCVAAHRVLLLRNDPRANPLLLKAREFLDLHAARISDETLRRSFLRNHAAHRTILTLTGDGLATRTE